MSGNKSGLIGIVASGVGMASEYREHRKYQKQQKLSRENSHDVEQAPAAGPSTSNTTAHSPDGLPPYAEASNGNNGHVLATGGPAYDDKKVGLSQYESDDSLSVEEDEEDWELDEMLPSYDDSETNNRTTDQLAQDVMLNSRAATEVPRERKPLPLPVVIPQRRPRNKARGFVRAYAPVMADSGIDQATFLSFLDNFHKSSQASPIFGIICLSCAIAGMAPSVIAMAVTTAVSLAAQAGAEVQQRQRTNSFLEKMNEELFKPAGLYAFIMKYKPDEKDTNQWSKVFEIRGEKVDLSTNQIIAKYATSSSSEQGNGSGMSERMRDLRVASGKTRGALALPEAAELIFPDIDNAVARNGAEETFKDKTKDAKLFLADYLDRRAHVQQALDDPNSTLTIPKEQRSFRSKLADPNHPIYQGKAGIQSMVLGGKTDSRTPEIEHRADRRNRINEHRGLMSQQRLGGGLQLGQRQQGRSDQGRSSGGRGGGLGGFGGLGGGLGGGRGGNGGGLLGLVGSAVTAISDRGNKQSASAASNNARSQDTFDERYERDDNAGNSQTGGADQNSNGRNQQRSQQSPLSAVKRIMRQDVLYLMIVNMPSEAEMAEARAELERTKSR
ncbi:hypothetical protein LTS10_012978 [Elasticomyces elasticus]|nr:hypothetical protein LTS10_012978 [Elasticomyces elasticus]